ncbi:hypothetical protein ACHAWF_018852 [Thalassiosira exigua]
MDAIAAPADAPLGGPGAYTFSLGMSASDSSSPRLCPRRWKRKRVPLVILMSMSICLATTCPISEAFRIPHHDRSRRRASAAHHLTTSCPAKLRRPFQDKINGSSHCGDVHLSMTTKNDKDGDDGSIVGASLLFAGTAVGAGMIALPAETVDAGFVPSVFGLLLCWAFTYATSLVTLEACWLTSSSNKFDHNDDGGGSGFLSISRLALGVPGEVVTAALFWFLLTAILVAYTAEGGEIISQVMKEITQTNVEPSLGSLIFATFFGCLSTYGTSRVDAINRFFVFGLVATFLGLVGVGLPMVKASLLSHSDWGMVYPPVISIGILSFGAQNVVPTLFQYLNCDPVKTRRAILLGTLLPLILYITWEAVFLGVIDVTNTGGENKMEVVSALGRAGGTVVTDLVEWFSLCAIGSSMAGASVSLVDFFQDALSILSQDGKASEGELLSSSGTFESRPLAAALALVPPVILAYAFPDIFIVALEEAGLLGGVSLYGIIPAVSILALRGSFYGATTQKIMPGRLGGGDTSLILLVAVSSALVLPEIGHICGLCLIIPEGWTEASGLDR